MAEVLSNGSGRLLLEGLVLRPSDVGVGPAGGVVKVAGAVVVTTQGWATSSANREQLVRTWERASAGYSR
jgi:hypothetical protein